MTEMPTKALVDKNEELGWTVDDIANVVLKVLGELQKREEIN